MPGTLTQLFVKCILKFNLPYTVTTGTSRDIGTKTTLLLMGMHKPQPISKPQLLIRGKDKRQPDSFKLNQPLTNNDNCPQLKHESTAQLLLPMNQKIYSVSLNLFLILAQWSNWHLY